MFKQRAEFDVEEILDEAFDEEISSSSRSSSQESECMHNEKQQQDYDAARIAIARDTYNVQN